MSATRLGVNKHYPTGHFFFARTNEERSSSSILLRANEKEVGGITVGNIHQFGIKYF